jgi:hypothetical protein
MIMNERIQELISAYLHRGSTPEQERELFDACSRNPETAELLRQHLILSLKLHGLRDDVRVPTDLHNSVLRRINALEAEGMHREAERIRKEEAGTRLHADSSATQASVDRPSVSHPGRRFGWAHLLGTGVAGAVCALAFLLLSGGPGTDTAMQPVAGLQDTVFVVKTDTLTQLREVERPVYIVRNVPVPDRAKSSMPAGVSDADLRSDGVTETEDALADGASQEDTQPANLSGEGIVPTQKPSEPVFHFADLQRQDHGTREEKTQNYLEQYNSMLVSVESVQLSTKDRLH